MGSGLSTELGDRSLHNENYVELKDILHRVRQQDSTYAVCDLSNRFIGVEGARQAADTIARNRVVKDLNLSYNNLGGSGRKGRRKLTEQATGISLLETALGVNMSLTSLNLAGNSLGNEGAAVVSRILAENKYLTHLSLFNNYIDDNAVDGLAEALAQNTSLTSLNLNYNDISDVGANALQKLLSVNTSLTNLELKHNDGITEIALKQLEDGLSRNRETQAKAQSEKEAAAQREKERLEEEEKERQKKEEELKLAREQIERDYLQLEEQKRQEQERREWENYENELTRMQRKRLAEEKAREKQEHTENLVNLAYSWRSTVHGGPRRGREWRAGFQTMKDGSMRDTFTPPAFTDAVKRRLHPCWCEPTEQSVLYGGQLHYHCVAEPQAADQMTEDGKARKYLGCCSTPHRCQSAPIAKLKKDRRAGDGLFSATAPAATTQPAADETK